MHDGVMQDGSHAPANRLTETYSLGLKRHSLIPVKTKYLLTSTPWLYRRLKFRAHRGHMLTMCWFSIGSRAHVRLTWCKQGLVYKCFSLFLFCAFWSNSKQKAKQYTENLIAKLQNFNQNFCLSWVSLIGLWTTQPRGSAFRHG